MSTVTEQVAAPRIRSDAPWWRSRLGQTATIVGVVLIAFLLLRGDFPWPGWLAWDTLGAQLDRFQRWLIAQRSAEDQSIVFALFDGFRLLVDDLVTWLTDLLLWMTWIGTAAAGTLIVLRFGGWKAGLGVLAAFAFFAGVSSPAAPTASSARSRRCSTRCRSCRRSRT
jgi:hypothetical protein